MGAGCCTDMGGAVKLMEGIDPNVQIIGTIAGNVLDTVYFRLPDKSWGAVIPAMGYTPAAAKDMAQTAMDTVAMIVQEDRVS